MITVTVAADRRAQSEQLEFTDGDYQKELEHIEKAPFEEKHRSYFDFQRRTGDLPVQKEGEEVDYRGLLHRDGSVLMSVSLNQLKTPELFYRSLAAKLVLGMPFKVSSFFVT
ncbi:putative (E)-4-hydroxy-3-methylbut-2-enyl-diphosphate synthase (ferredoxin) [Helianthus annuus]|uniref:(E)-4-hydroxy-3-methylbut-2-enyl-diphosphate synthase (Ferredoxin) n=1 Tax=Helianthus annuus TaxID=4232 RepID=A0A9K3HI09_HELAN|nr:putative (E)-4-hydroxy-3-methylbut-2-enyl-diphosphate synthase (ferredoxin) [Helianthus annuus]KAJ0863470.1 putative (E)-4-hydroxy-3-methylbut-2-enyl-diphosphate synthase (ferredoxin) [Helianthus annuus]